MEADTTVHTTVWWWAQERGAPARLLARTHASLHGSRNRRDLPFAHHNDRASQACVFMQGEGTPALVGRRGGIVNGHSGQRLEAQGQAAEIVATIWREARHSTRPCCGSLYMHFAFKDTCKLGRSGGLEKLGAKAATPPSCDG